MSGFLCRFNWFFCFLHCFLHSTSRLQYFIPVVFHTSCFLYPYYMFSVLSNSFFCNIYSMLSVLHTSSIFCLFNSCLQFFNPPPLTSDWSLNLFFCCTLCLLFSAVRYLVICSLFHHSFFLHIAPFLFSFLLIFNSLYWFQFYVNSSSRSVYSGSWWRTQ